VDDEFRNVTVVLRSANEDERVWSVEVDAYTPYEDLIVDLLKELKISGVAEDYDLRAEGSIAEPLLVLKRKDRSRVRAIREHPQKSNVKPR